MTCKKNFVLLGLMGTALLGLNGCQSQTYKPWQTEDSRVENGAAVAQSAEQASESAQIQTYTPAELATESAPDAPPPMVVREADSHLASGATAATVSTEDLVVESTPVPVSMPQQADVPPPVQTSETLEPQAYRATAPAKTTGDVLLIQSIQSTAAIQTPRKGLNMADVRSTFGNPVSEGRRVGDPPITRWEYNGFSVYFEHDRVLHSVVHRPTRN